MKLDYIPKNKQQIKAIKNLYQKIVILMKFLVLFFLTRQSEGGKEIKK